MTVVFWFGRRFGPALFLTVLLTACVTVGSSPPPVSLYPVFETLGPKPLFATLEDPSTWISIGDPTLKQASVIKDGGQAAVKLSPGTRPIALGKTLDARLLATPYLTWSWKVSRFSGPTHPIYLTIGFKGGGTADPTPASADLPDHDRALNLLWGQSGLKRGWLEPTSKPSKKGRIPKFFVRGGQETTLSWHGEGIDLLGLYQQLWPNDKTEEVRVAFVVASARSNRPSSDARPEGALIRNIKLMR